MSNCCGTSRTRHRWRFGTCSLERWRNRSSDRAAATDKLCNESTRDFLACLAFVVLQKGNKGLSRIYTGSRRELARVFVSFLLAICPNSSRLTVYTGLRVNLHFLANDYIGNNGFSNMTKTFSAKIAGVHNEMLAAKTICASSCNILQMIFLSASSRRILGELLLLM